MQPVKLIIPGRYWDTQIYKGRLYAFTEEGDLLVLDWDRLIDGVRIDEHLRVPFEYAFRRSNRLYSETSLRDPDVKKLMISKFNKLSSKTIEITPAQVEKILISRRKSPFPFPHADSTVYKDTFYIASQSGVFRATCGKNKKFGVSTRPRKDWDGSVFHVEASYNRLALAAGDDGLFELAVDVFGSDHEPKEVSSKSCTSCSWVFHSIYGSSHETSGFLADYVRRRRRANDRPISDVDENGRWLRAIVSSDDIFHEQGYSWAAQDRICLATNGTVRIANYAPFDEAEQVTRRGKIDVRLRRHGRVLAGGIALYGTIIEYQNGLVVSLSDSTTWKCTDRITAWRNFPRSRNYENQLHVIHDDRLEVLSFNNDYFVDQDHKISGITYFDPDARPRWQRRARAQQFYDDRQANWEDEQRALPARPKQKLLIDGKKYQPGP